MASAGRSSADPLLGCIQQCGGCAPQPPKLKDCKLPSCSISLTGAFTSILLFPFCSVPQLFCLLHRAHPWMPFSSLHLSSCYLRSFTQTQCNITTSHLGICGGSGLPTGETWSSVPHTLSPLTSLGVYPTASQNFSDCAHGFL